MTDRQAKVAVALCLLAAVVRAATGRPPHDLIGTQVPITPEVGVRAFQAVTSRERTMRREAALKFPGDLWSEDDDFHEREQREVRSFATANQVGIGDVLGALDDGMKKNWATSVQPYPKVPPCRPRLSY